MVETVVVCKKNSIASLLVLLILSSAPAEYASDWDESYQPYTRHYEPTESEPQDTGQATDNAGICPPQSDRYDAAINGSADSADNSATYTEPSGRGFSQGITPDAEPQNAAGQVPGLL